jgi:transcriptional regulator with XRE-family HTH domain
MLHSTMGLLRGKGMITAKQIRAGRALLGWTAQELANKAGTSIDVVQRLETEKVAIAKARAGTIQKIEGALTDAGVDLLNGDGVRMRQQGEGANR